MNTTCLRQSFKLAILKNSTSNGATPAEIDVEVHKDATEPALERLAKILFALLGTDRESVDMMEVDFSCPAASGRKGRMEKALHSTTWGREQGRGRVNRLISELTDTPGRIIKIHSP